MFKPSQIFLVLSLSLLSFTMARGQANCPSLDNDRFQNSTFTWYATATVPGIKTIDHSGSDAVKVNSSGLEGGFKYALNLGEHFGIESGLGIGYANYSNNTQIQTPDYIDMSGFTVPYLSAPFILEVRFKVSKNWFLYGGAGMVAKFFENAGDQYSSGYGNTNGTETQNWVSSSDISKNSVDIIPKFEIGGLYRLRNNMIRINLDVQPAIYNSKELQFSYYDFNGNKTSSGTYHTSPGYIGLSAGYVITHNRKFSVVRPQTD